MCHSNKLRISAYTWFRISSVYFARTIRIPIFSIIYIWKDQAVNNEKLKHLLASLSVELKMNSFRHASVTSEIATDADNTWKLKLCFAVKVICVVK